MQIIKIKEFFIEHSEFMKKSAFSSWCKIYFRWFPVIFRAERRVIHPCKTYVA